MVDFIQKDRYDFNDLRKLVTFLRSDHGCTWDHAQTHASIRRNLIEEAYEACEGIDNDDAALMREELGDVLLQVVFHADIERERGRFTIDDVCDRVCKKLVYRHPHLFGGEAQDWDEMKKREKGASSAAELMDGVARSLPALIRAEKLHEKAAKVDLRRDYDAQAQTVRQSLDALTAAAPDSAQAHEALGEALLALVAAGLERDPDPEGALHDACERYIRRAAAEQHVSLPETGKNKKTNEKRNTQ